MSSSHEPAASAAPAFPRPARNVRRSHEVAVWIGISPNSHERAHYATPGSIMRRSHRGMAIMHRTISIPVIARRLLAAVACLLAGTASQAQRGEPIPQQLTFTPYHASGIYDVGDTVGWAVTPGPAAPAYRYRWTIRQNNAVTLK